MFDALGDGETPCGESRNPPFAISDIRQVVQSSFNWLLMSSILLEQMSFSIPPCDILRMAWLKSRFGNTKTWKGFSQIFPLMHPLFGSGYSHLVTPHFWEARLDGQTR